MRQKYVSRTLKGVAYLWMSFPISYLFYSGVVMNVTAAGLVKLVLSPWYWAVCTLAVTAGFGILKIRWYGWYAFLFSNFTITYEVALTLAHYSEGKFKFTAFITTVIFQTIFIFLVGKEIRVPYFFPRIRWWESDPRYKLSVPTKLTKDSKAEFEGEILDISLGGCFVKTHGYFLPDETITLDFMVFERPVQCLGKIVWRTNSTVTHPKGIGVKFEPLDRDTIFCLKQATSKLRKLARVYSQITREKNWQEYLQRENKYQGRKK